MFYFIEPQGLLLNGERLFEKTLKSGTMSRKSSYSTVETTTDYTISIDVPGVKADDVSITFDNEALSIQAGKLFSKAFEIDPKVVNVDNIKAELIDGVLTVTIPKPEPVSIDVVTSDLETTTDEHGFTTAIDVPGVKLEDLSVTFRDNSYLSVEATRQVGNRKREISKTITVDTEKYDVSKAGARLNHGVLIVSMPQKPESAPLEIEIDTADDALPNDSKKTSDDHFELSMDLPGVKKSDVSIKVKDNVLSIVASRTYSNGPNRNKKMRMAKETLLDPRVQRNNLRAKLVDGVLVVTAPLDERPAVKTIPVSTNGNEGQMVPKKTAALVPKDETEKST